MALAGSSSTQEMGPTGRCGAAVLELVNEAEGGIIHSSSCSLLAPSLVPQLVQREGAAAAALKVCA